MEEKAAAKEAEKKAKSDAKEVEKAKEAEKKSKAEEVPFCLQVFEKLWVDQRFFGHKID